MAMREIAVERVTELVRKLCIESNTILGDDMIEAYKQGMAKRSPLRWAKMFSVSYSKMRRSRRDEGIAACQDTGMVIVFMELGQDVHLVGGNVNEAIPEGVRQGYRDGCFRASTLDPLTRKNFGDNTPPLFMWRSCRETN